MKTLCAAVLLPLLLPLLLPVAARCADGPLVKVEPANLHGSRELEERTGTAVVKDYLESWDTLGSALDGNQAASLGLYFTGTALAELTRTVADQSRIGIHTRYVARSHDLQVVFYSPEGLSIQMTDMVEYDEQVMDKDKVLSSKPVQRRYLVVMTPSQVRWQVRIFQAQPITQPS